MILSQALTDLGDLLDDDNGSKFPLAYRVRALDTAVQGLFRQLVDGNKEHSVFTMSLNATSAVQVLTNVWEFRIPTWVMHVIEVTRRDSDPTTETTFSPYMWTGATNSRVGIPVEKYSPSTTQPKWAWEGMHTLRLYNFATVPSIFLRVVVRPPPMLKFTVDAVNASASKVTLPVTPTLGTINSEEGTFINSEFQVTLANSETNVNLGTVRRVVYSKGTTEEGGALRTECTLDAAWSSALASGDVVESLVPIASEHCRLVVLKAAQACFIRKPNVQATNMMNRELGEELKKFMDYATTPRDKRGPSFVKRSGRAGYWSDPNRVPYWP